MVRAEAAVHPPRRPLSRCPRNAASAGSARRRAASSSPSRTAGAQGARRRRPPALAGYTCSKGRALPAWHHARAPRPPVWTGATPAGAPCSTTWRPARPSVRAQADAVSLYLATGLAYDAGPGRRALALRPRQRPFYSAATSTAAGAGGGRAGGEQRPQPGVGAGLRRALLVVGNPVVSHGYGTTLPAR
jgi:hypothetical protein